MSCDMLTFMQFIICLILHFLNQTLLSSNQDHPLVICINHWPPIVPRQNGITTSPTWSSSIKCSKSTIVKLNSLWLGEKQNIFRHLIILNLDFVSSQPFLSFHRLTICASQSAISCIKTEPGGHHIRSISWGGRLRSSLRPYPVNNAPPLKVWWTANWTADNNTRLE